MASASVKPDWTVHAINCTQELLKLVVVSRRRQCRIPRCTKLAGFVPRSTRVDDEEAICTVVIAARYFACVDIADCYSTVHIHTYDNAYHSQAQGLNLRRGRSLGGERTVDMNDEQTDVVFR